MDQKRKLRRHMLKLRRGLTPAEVEARSEKVLENLRSSGLLEGRGLVALYAAADREVRTRPLFEQLRSRGVKMVLPRVRGKGPVTDFYPVTDWDRLERSSLGIPEPAAEGDPVSYGEFDLILVPGVAFDQLGGRLGYGMGCYDRVLEKTRDDAPRVAIAFDFQVIKKGEPVTVGEGKESVQYDRVPMDDHDVRLTAVVSESGVTLLRAGGD